MSILPNQSFETQKEAWKKYGLELIQTGDGSPTLREKQAMHHLGGALSETSYIYGEILQRAAPFEEPPNALVVGLGLGYIEHLCSRYFNKYEAWERGARLVSYESRKDLRELMSLSLTEPYSLGLAAPAGTEELQTFFDVQNFVEKFNLGFQHPSVLNQAFQKQQYQIRESLSLNSLPEEKFNLVFFDAYSAQASPDLWSEEFFLRFLSQCTNEQCFLSTYACTGLLQRMLKKFNFNVIKRPGFKGKRESLWAQRTSWRS